jgi:DNA ligase D-like protein (predicted 3'-phosphoesterase)
VSPCRSAVRLVAAYPSAVTGEPDRAAPRPAFVLHEHHKPRHHFDLRLEENGVLRSWAVPRGLPVDTGHNRLAVAVPDHALDHLTYHDADKSIADTGWWEEHDRNERRIVFTLHGRRGSHRYALIRTDRDWLLRLTNDQP